MYANEFARVWHKLSKDMKTQLETELAPTLTESQLFVLELLELEERMKPSNFIQHLATTPAAVTTLLDRMEKGGLIERIRDERDRRIVWVHATEKGKAECIRGKEARQRCIELYLGRISSHNQQLLVYLLGKVANL